MTLLLLFPDYMKWGLQDTPSEVCWDREQVEQHREEYKRLSIVLMPHPAQFIHIRILVGVVTVLQHNWCILLFNSMCCSLLLASSLSLNMQSCAVPCPRWSISRVGPKRTWLTSKQVVVTSPWPLPTHAKPLCSPLNKRVLWDKREIRF